MSTCTAHDAFAVRARLRAELEDRLPSAFTRAFDAWAPGEAVLRIPRLELKLRIASLDELAGALSDALCRETPRTAPPIPGAAAAVDRLQVLLRYLETGELEWHAVHADAVTAAVALRETALGERQIAAARAPAGAAPFEDAMHYYMRLLQLLPGERWCEIAASLESSAPSAHGLADVAAYEETIRYCIQRLHPLSEGRWREIATSLGLSAACRLREEHAGEPVATRHVAGPNPVAVMRAIAGAHARLGERATLVLAAAVLAAVQRKAPSADRLLEETARAPDDEALEALPGPAPQFPEPRSRLSSSPARDVPRVSAPPPRQHAAARTFALMASHSGLVLLHPFLPRLFETCGLYAPRRNLEACELPRAAALLHWLAAGRDEIYEFELGAVKLLLGLSPEAPLPVSAGLLGEREREEGAELLRAAIGHWKALQGTSIDGLRVSFLQRRGALREEETGWRLQLEPESFDVLLGRLPWGFATLRLPWMTRPLYTDWPTR